MRRPSRRPGTPYRRLVVVDDSDRARLPGGPRHLARRRRPPTDGVESNSRLTGATAVVLLVLLAVEGVTLLGVRQHLDIHVFVGMLVIPPVLVKIGSTTWRFFRYYRGDPAYRRKGPPPMVLRLLGPLLVVLTAVLLASGVALGGRLLFIHQASFVLWVGAMVIHVLGHLAETARLAPMDLARRTRAQVAGASARQWTIVASLAVGVVLGLVMLGPAATYLGHSAFLHHHHIH
jgi:hypothetical protein